MSWQRGVGFGICAATFIMASPAHARKLRGAGMIMLSGSVVDYASTSLKLTKDSQHGEVTNAPESSSSTLSYGPLGPGLGFGAGGMVTEMLLLGGQASVQGTSSDANVTGSNLKTEGTSVRILPRVELVFPGNAARFYLAGLFGVQYTRATSTVPVPASASPSATEFSTELSGTSGVVGLSAGVHAFLTDSLSLEPALTVLGSSGSSTTTSKGGGSSSSSFSNPDQVREYSNTGTSVLLTFGLGGWLGGAPSSTKHHKRASDAPEPAPPAPVVLSHRIDLPHGRQLELRVARDPSLPSVTVRFSGGPEDKPLPACYDIRIVNGTEASPLHLSTGSSLARYVAPQHSVAGTLPLEAVVAIAQGHAKVEVCGTTWKLSKRARAEARRFLKWRRELIGAEPLPDDNSEEPENEVNPAPDAPPPASDGSAPVPEAPAPPAGAAPAPPTGAAPASAPLSNGAAPASPVPIAPAAK